MHVHVSMCKHACEYMQMTQVCMCVCMYVDKKYVCVHVTNVHEGVGIRLSHVHTHACPRVRSSHVRIYPTLVYACQVYIRIPYPHVRSSHVHTCLPSCMLVTYPTLVHECMRQAYMRVGMCVYMWRAYMMVECTCDKHIYEGRVYAYMWRAYMRCVCTYDEGTLGPTVCVCTCDKRTWG